MRIDHAIAWKIDNELGNAIDDIEQMANEVEPELGHDEIFEEYVTRIRGELMSLRKWVSGLNGA